METLWAPWRMEYILQDKSGACVFCEALKERKPDRGNLVLYVGRSAAVIMNRFPYGHGHLLVMPLRHTDDFVSLSQEENLELIQLLQISTSILAEAMHPEGFNMGINLGATAGAGVTDHLHWHAVPRWPGDVNFMPLLSEVKSIPQHIAATYDILYPLFEKQAAV